MPISEQVRQIPEELKFAAPPINLSEEIIPVVIDPNGAADFQTTMRVVRNKFTGNTVVEDAERIFSGMASRLEEKAVASIRQNAEKSVRDSRTRESEGNVIVFAMAKLPGKEKLEELYLGEGLTEEVIGKRYGATRQAVSLALDKYGIPTQYGHDINPIEASSLYQAGENFTFLRERLHADHDRIKNVLENAGVVIRPIGRPKKTIPDALGLELEDLYHTHTEAEIAELVDRSQTWVSHALRKLGIQTRKKGTRP